MDFDVFLFAAFMATAWAIWRERQVLILLLAGIGTMLCCDAWFDAWFDVGTRGPAEDRTCSLRRTPLSGHGLDEALPRGRARRPA